MYVSYIHEAKKTQNTLKPETSNTLDRSLQNVTLLMPCDCLANQSYDLALSMRFALEEKAESVPKRYSSTTYDFWTCFDSPITNEKEPDRIP